MLQCLHTFHGGLPHVLGHPLEIAVHDSPGAEGDEPDAQAQVQVVPALPAGLLLEAGGPSHGTVKALGVTAEVARESQVQLNREGGG